MCNYVCLTVDNEVNPLFMWLDTPPHISYIKMSRSARKAIEQSASDKSKKEVRLQDEGIGSLEDLPRLCE